MPLIRKVTGVIILDKKMYVTMDVVFHASTMYFADEFALQGEKKSEVQTLGHGFTPTNDVPQNSIIYLETSGENLDLDGECQLTEVDELVIETTPTCQEELTNLSLRPANRPKNIVFQQPVT